MENGRRRLGGDLSLHHTRSVAGGTLMQSWPLAVRTLAITALVVPLMVFLLLPVLQRLLGPGCADRRNQGEHGPRAPMASTRRWSPTGSSGTRHSGWNTPAVPEGRSRPAPPPPSAHGPHAAGSLPTRDSEDRACNHGLCHRLPRDGLVGDPAGRELHRAGASSRGCRVRHRTGPRACDPGRRVDGCDSCR